MTIDIIWFACSVLLEALKDRKLVAKAKNKLREVRDALNRLPLDV